MNYQRLSQTRTAKTNPQPQDKTRADYTPHPIEELQGWIGNRAMGRILKAQRMSQESGNSPPEWGYATLNRGSILRKPLFRGLSHEWEAEQARRGTPVQTKLTLGKAGDKYEQEADAVAHQVVNQINSPTPSAANQEDKENQPNPFNTETLPSQNTPIATKPNPPSFPTSLNPGETVSQPIEQGIQQARSGGVPLAEGIRKPMEQAFGADFSGVRVHTDAQSDALNQSLSSRAFTTGQDIFFRQGEYNPGSRGGQELLAHELTHVVQQGGGVRREEIGRQSSQLGGFVLQRQIDMGLLNQLTNVETLKQLSDWMFTIKINQSKETLEQAVKSFVQHQDNLVQDVQRRWLKLLNKRRELITLQVYANSQQSQGNEYKKKLLEAKSIIRAIAVMINMQENDESTETSDNLWETQYVSDQMKEIEEISLHRDRYEELSSDEQQNLQKQSRKLRLLSNLNKQHVSDFLTALKIGNCDIFQKMELGEYQRLYSLVDAARTDFELKGNNMELAAKWAEQQAFTPREFVERYEYYIHYRSKQNQKGVPDPPTFEAGGFHKTLKEKCQQIGLVTTTVLPEQVRLRKRHLCAWLVINADKIGFKSPEAAAYHVMKHVKEIYPENPELEAEIRAYQQEARFTIRKVALGEGSLSQDGQVINLIFDTGEERVVIGVSRSDRTVWLATYFEKQ